MPNPEAASPAVLNRLRRLPQEALDVWELAVVRLPQWAHDGDGMPFRMWAMVACSRERRAGAIGRMGAPDERHAFDPLEALDQLSQQRGVGYRPTRVAVPDAALAEAVRDRLAPLGITVEVEPALRELPDFMAAARTFALGDDPEPGYLAGAGVTPARVRALAEAAVAFERAAIWNHLNDLDLIEIESETPDDGFDCAVVTGNVGLLRGVMFFASPDAHDRMIESEDADDAVFDEPNWGIALRPLPDVAMDDADLWEDHALPTSGEGLVPWFAREHDHRTERPDAEALAFGEGLLLALAATTEDELDAGRWTKRVRTFDGEREFTLALPGVLDPAPPDEHGDPHFTERIMTDLSRLMREKGVESEAEAEAFANTFVGRRVPHPEPVTPAERATDLLVAAWGSEGRQRIKLARRALATWPDCADAWVLMTDETPDVRRAHALASQGVLAGERALGPEAFRERVGHFWGIVETRPYMRALVKRAQLAAELERPDEAVADYREVLRLNPGDHQGVRLVLAPYLLELGRDDEAGELLERYPDDAAAMLQFARALLAFRRHGAGAEANAALARAVRANRHALKYLVDTTGPGPQPDDGAYGPGDEREAVRIDEELGLAFEDTPGAIEWLRRHRRDAKKAREAKRKKK